mgnify:CR=1 FL=1
MVGIRRPHGHGRQKHHAGVITLHALHHRAVAVAVPPGGGGGIICLQIAHFNSRVLDRLPAVGHDALHRVAVRQAEVDDRLHILGHHVAGLAAALDDGWGHCGGDEGKQRPVPETVSGDGVRVGLHILHQGFQRLRGDVGSQRFKGTFHHGAEPHRKGSAGDIRNGAGQVLQRRAAVGSAGMAADGADRQFQVRIALLHQVHMGDGNIRSTEGRAGLDLAAALVQSKF